MAQQTSSAVGPGGVPKGSKTSEYYKTKDIPTRFDNPGAGHNIGNPVFSCNSATRSQPAAQTTGQQGDWFQGYGGKVENPMYRTSNTDYGGRSPSVHTMPLSFHAKSQKFSEQLGSCGMYRNHSLNCSNDKSNVPDH